jgi:transposase-like protein
MAQRRTKYSPEFKEEAAKLVIDSARSIADVAREIGVNETTLGTWVAKYRTEHADDEPPLNVSERARLRELERENRELRMKTEFLGKAAAFFAQEHR